MAENTHISWADDTFNPWMGCTKVSPACDGCYAEALMDTRYGKVKWGPHGERVRTGAANWAKPRKWEREQTGKVRAWEQGDPGFPQVLPVYRGGSEGPRPSRFVFCASLADVFDNAVPTEWRRDLFTLILATPHLTWLLLTKRPQNILRLFREVNPCADEATLMHMWPKNAAIGCTVVTQDEADRDIPVLLRAKAVLEPAFAFASIEPLLSSVNLRHLSVGNDMHFDALTSAYQVGVSGYTDLTAALGAHPCRHLPSLDWVITGGETDQGAHKARPSHTDWFRSLRDQCATAGVPYHHKQNGEWAPIDPDDGCPNPVYRVGKKAAGRLLDGVAHDARPLVNRPVDERVPA